MRGNSVSRSEPVPISTRELGELPSVPVLERICQSLAMLDAILSPQWDYRYFSFNCKWDPALNERVGSMRSGSGDEYFILFSPVGVFMKGFAHECVMSPWTREDRKVWPGVLDAVPSVFSAFLTEPAFNLKDRSRRWAITPFRARPNRRGGAARSDRLSGRLLEPVRNGGPRGMTAARKGTETGL